MIIIYQVLFNIYLSVLCRGDDCVGFLVKNIFEKNDYTPNPVAIVQYANAIEI